MLNATLFENVIVLSHKLSVYVPATNDVNHAIDNSEQVDACASLLAKLFGGATSSQAIGYWQSNEMGLVKENTTIVFAFVSGEDEEKIGQVINFCQKMKVDMNQESVAFEYDNQMYLL